MKLSIVTIICLVSILFGSDINLIPYVTNSPVDSVDENSEIGTVIARIMLDDQSLANSPYVVACDDTTNFRLEQKNLNEKGFQLWLTTNRIFDYDDTTQPRTFPLTLTVSKGDIRVYKKITMIIKPKDDCQFRGSGFVLALRENDSVHLNLADLAAGQNAKLNITPPLFTDDDIPASENRHTFFGVIPPVHGSFNMDSASLGIFSYNPDEKGNEFALDSFAYFIRDYTTYDKSDLTNDDPYWVIFKLKNVNDEPVFATDDTVWVDEKERATKTIHGALSLIANDHDMDNDSMRLGDNIAPLTAKLISSSKGVSGTMTVNSDGTFRYVQTGGGEPEKFIVEIFDGIHKDTSAVIVQITLLNDNVPAFNPETLTVVQGETVTAFANGEHSLMQRATDADMPNDTLSFVPFSGKTLAGTANINRDGTFRYTHSGNRIFVDSIPVSVKDAAGHWVNSFIPVKVIPSAMVPLSVTVSPISGMVPDSSIFSNAMKLNVEPVPSLVVGMLCEIQCNRRIEQSDLTIEATIYDVVGNQVATSTYPENTNPAFQISRHENGSVVRLFWNGRNESGRSVGGGSYLIHVKVSDRYTNESATGSANWGIRLSNGERE